MKPTKAYAILNRRGGLVLRDGRLPLFWKQSVAEMHPDFAWMQPYKVLAVEVRELKPKRPRKVKP